MDSGIQELNFTPVEITVIIDEISTVSPAGSIPAAPGDRHYLSNLDDALGSRVMTPTVYFFRKSPTCKRNPASVLREAMARLLVPYYPFSARLRETENGKLEVFFAPGQGALMVSARTEAAIHDLGALDVPNPSWAPLVYCPPDEKPYNVVDTPLLSAQVTDFACGGFSLGLRVCHCICDGLGAMQLVRAWAALARSGSAAAALDPEPCWDREVFQPRDPPVVSFPHHEYARVEDNSTIGEFFSQSKLVQRCYKVSAEFQARVKHLAQPAGGEYGCSTFDAMAAHVWRCWVEALGVRPAESQLRLSFSVNLRPKLANPPLREGFYGNAIGVGCATSTPGALADGGLRGAARLVRAARVGVTEEYARSAVDYMEVHRPKQLEFGGKLTVTQWTRFAMYESADFGWGRPVYAGPISLMATPQVCIFLPDRDGGGGMIVSICVPESCSTRFAECFGRFDPGQ